MATNSPRNQNLRFEFMKKILILSLLFIVCVPFVSCSHADDVPEEHLVEVERTIKDTITNNDTINNPSNNNSSNTVVVVKDTIKLSYEKYMGLTPSYGTVQGAACYNKYLFQGYSNNATLGVYDLEKKHAICKLDIPGPEPSSRTHANTVNFGNERLSPDDYFPLLYISSGYTKNINGTPCSFIYVYRISKYDNSDGSEGFHIEFVQTITLKDMGGWTDCVTDNDHNILWIKYVASGDERRCASFPMPRLKDGDITLVKENAITDFSLGVQSVTSYNQGHFYHKDKILFVSGTSYKTQKLAFVVVNLLTQCYELVIDLAEIGLLEEPENVFIYNNQLMIGYSHAIYKFNIYQYPNNKH